MKLNNHLIWLIIVSNQSLANCALEKMPPRSWLGEKTTLSAIKEQRQKRCIAINNAIPVIDENCDVEKPIFKTKVSKNGKIYWFSNGKKCFSVLAGRSGWVYEENGRLIEYALEYIN